MPSVSSVELTNTFDDWRTRTNDIVTIINAANSADPASAITFANSEGGFAVNTITTNSVTGTLMTGTRLVLTGGNVNFTSANVASAGNVHQVHVLGGTSIDVSTTADADSSIANTFIFNSKINLNGQKFVSGASDINLQGATISNLGSVAKLTSTAVTGGDVSFTNPRISITSSVGSLTISSGTQDFSGATIASALLTPYTARAGTVEASNVVVNGAGFLVSTNSVALGVDVGTSNVGIGKFTEVSTNITSEKRPTSSKGRLHVRTDFSAGSAAATAVEASADELVLEGNTAVGLTLLANNASNTHIAFGDPDNTDVGGLIYNHATDDLHIVNEGANTAIFQNNFGGALQIAGGDTLGTTAGKLHVNVGSTDATTGLFVDSNDADQKAISVSASQTTMNVFQIDSTTLTTGSAIGIHDNSADTGARNILNIDQDHVDATGGIALNVKTDGMLGVNITQNKASAKALAVSTTTAHSVNLAEFIDDGDCSGNTVFIRSDSTSATQKTLEVANSSASLFTVVAGGKVGINDNAPDYTLDITGTVRTTSDAFFNNDVYVATKIVHEGDTDTKILFGTNNIDFVTEDELQLKLDSSTSYLYHNGNERFRTDASGVVVSGNVYVTESIVHWADTDTKISFTDNNIHFQTQGENKIVIGTESLILYYDGNQKLETATGGISVTGTIVASGSSVCANGIECRLRVLDESGNALNTC